MAPDRPPLGARERRVLVARVHETAALLLAAGCLGVAAAQLRDKAGWGDWAPLLITAAAFSVVRAVVIRVWPSAPLRTERSVLWGALALAAPAASAGLTTAGGW